MDPSQIYENQPTVVIAGWLGCEPKSLKRYSLIYQNLGWNVITQIANPQMIAQCILSSPSSCCQSQNVVQHSSYKPKTTRENHHDLQTINDLAWSTINHIYHNLINHQSPLFVLHLFSNGGAFLWEAIHYILHQSKHNDINKVEMNIYEYSKKEEQQNQIMINIVKNNLAGIIFDSAPCYYSNNTHLIQDAFKYCSLEDQMKVKRLFQLYDNSHYTCNTQQKFGDNSTLCHHSFMNRRASEYWSIMRNNSCNIPELYIYSKNDHLAPYKELQELICHRKQIWTKHGIATKSHHNICNKEYDHNDNDSECNSNTSKEIRSFTMIYDHLFEHSKHCSHLLMYPEVYCSILENFLLQCHNFRDRVSSEGNHGDLRSMDNVNLKSRL